MKTFIFSDEIDQFHGAILKSVLLTLSLLPVTDGLSQVWQLTEGSSQIMVGFFALSFGSVLLGLCFYLALNVSVFQLVHLQDPLGQLAVRVYRLVPMLFLASMLGYLTDQMI